MPLATIEPNPGEVWIVDFGTTAKQRPVVVLSQKRILKKIV
jgi:mRNA-degrading endonuclease toxin of MazEF toxin-antitoxin module